MASNNIESKVTELLENIINDLGYILYDVIYEKEAKNYYLRIIIDKEDEPIDIDDCVKVNDSINDILDEADYIKDQYFLEVSSPGLERVLRKEKHFISSIGKEVLIKLFKPINKVKEYTGILENFKDNIITIKLEDNTVLEFNLKDIALIKTIYNF